MIEIQCLGPTVVTLDGGQPPPELLWRKHLALLVYLALSPRGRTRDHLVGLLWPEKEEAKARHSLNEALRVIRRVAEDGLVTEGDLVRLDPSVVSLDLDEVDELGRATEFMEGFSVPDAPAFEDWMGVERNKRRGQSLEKLATAAADAVARGDLATGRAVAQRAMDVEPLHEPSVRVLMRIHALEGARALALQVYDRLSELLSRSLGLEPDLETLELAKRIRDQRIVRGAPPPDTAAHELVPMVGPGRDCLSKCVSVWHSTQVGRPTVIVLRGDPGTGKTRVGDELAARARLEGAVVAQARAFENDRVDAIWYALLRGGLAVPELGGAAPEVLAALGNTDPDLLTRFPSAREVVSATVPEPFAQAVFAVAEVRPVLLVFDDADRAEQRLIESITAMVQRAGAARLCVLLTASSGSLQVGVDELSQRIGREVPGDVVSTDYFTANDLDELVKWAFPEYDAESAERLRRRVMADTAGNPFLAVEFVRAVRAGLSVKDQRDSLVWPDRSRTLDQTIPGELPAAVAAALRMRFKDLTQDGQAMLRAIAVVGGAEPLELLARAADLPEKRAEAAVDELEWERWLAGDAHGYKFVTRLAELVVLSDMVTAGQRHRMLQRAGKA
jgi:DNA-binding SARP family transcriptional activator